jgi:ATP-dependent DNA helicase RecG
MRPTVLFPLFAPITSLKGIGPRLGPLYKHLCGEHVADLLWHLPVGAIDRSYSPPLKYADKDRVVTLVLDIAEHNPPPERRPNLPYKIVGADCSGEQVTIAYFNVKGDYLSRLYPTDRKVAVSGMLERYRGGWNMSHPDFVVPVERIGGIERQDAAQIGPAGARKNARLTRVARSHPACAGEMAGMERGIAGASRAEISGGGQSFAAGAQTTGL